MTLSRRTFLHLAAGTADLPMSFPLFQGVCRGSDAADFISHDYPPVLPRVIIMRLRRRKSCILMASR
jgi:hypothetical protein